jgi:serine/threonine protein kinase
MASVPTRCVIYADGSLVNSKIIGKGLDGFVVYNEPSTVLKIPKLYGCRLPDGTIKPLPNNEWASDLSGEKAIYERLRGIRGIAKYLGVLKDGLLLEYYGNGCLEEHMERNPPPPWPQRMDWILQIVDVFAACHAKKVLIFDIALRNLLLADDWTIRAIDFANSSLCPLEHTGELIDSDGYTARVDVLHVTNVIYSLSCWKKFQVDCVTMDEWPDVESLPSTMNLPLGSVIAKSWSRQFKDLDELRHAVVSATSQDPATPQVRPLLIQRPVLIICALACAAMLAVRLRPRIR